MEENINVYDKKDRKIISPKTYITKEKFVEIIMTKRITILF